MVYLDPNNMTREKREALLEWIQAESLDSGAIFNNGRFSVHKGRVSGERFVKPTEGDKKVLAHKHRAVTKHFNVPQINPLPEVFTQ